MAGRPSQGLSPAGSGRPLPPRRRRSLPDGPAVNLVCRRPSASGLPAGRQLCLQSSCPPTALGDQLPSPPIEPLFGTQPLAPTGNRRVYSVASLAAAGHVCSDICVGSPVAPCWSAEPAVMYSGGSVWVHSGGSVLVQSGGWLGAQRRLAVMQAWLVANWSIE